MLLFISLLLVLLYLKHRGRKSPKCVHKTGGQIELFGTLSPLTERLRELSTGKPMLPPSLSKDCSPNNKTYVSTAENSWIGSAGTIEMVSPSSVSTSPNHTFEVIACSPVRAATANACRERLVFSQGTFGGGTGPHSM